MEIKLITQKIRLDQIIYNYYDHLDFFLDVLKLNNHLLDKYSLDIGDKVLLPEYTQKTENKKRLWD